LRRDLDRGRTPALATASRSRPPSATTTAAAGDRRLRPLLRRPHRAGLRDLLTALASGELAGAAAGTMTVRARAIAGDRRRGRTRPGVVLRAVHGGIRFRCRAGGRFSRRSRSWAALSGGHSASPAPWCSPSWRTLYYAVAVVIVMASIGFLLGPSLVVARRVSSGTGWPSWSGSSSVPCWGSHRCRRRADARARAAQRCRGAVGIVAGFTLLFSALESTTFADGSFTSRIEDHWSWYAALRRSLWPDPLPGLPGEHPARQRSPELGDPRR
jgi:hypothetical protein